MKNPKKSRTANFLFSVFNVRSWIDYDRLRSFTAYLWGGIKKIFVPQKVKVVDTSANFADMVASLNLSDEDLKSREKGLYRSSLVMGSAAAIIFLYALYNMISGNIRATIVSLVITLLALVLGFRYHFWYYQIKEKKLGCTFREWYKRGLLGEK